jgi:hypothetical protein
VTPFWSSGVLDEYAFPRAAGYRRPWPAARMARSRRRVGQAPRGQSPASPPRCARAESSAGGRDRADRWPPGTSGELRVAEPAQDSQRSHRRPQPLVALRQILFAVRLGVAPRSGDPGERDAAELRDDRKLHVPVGLEHQQAAAWPLARENAWDLEIGVIPARQPVGVGVVVMDPDNVGGDTFPTVVADHGLV